MTTAERGLGSQHRRLRKQALAEMSDGECCWLCGFPMYASTDDLDLGRSPDRRYVTGLAHTSCNRAVGGYRAHADEPYEAFDEPILRPLDLSGRGIGSRHSRDW